MTQTKGRSRNRNKKLENQETQLSQQGETNIQPSSKVNEAKSYENEEIAKASNINKDTNVKKHNNKTIHNVFLTNMANRIINRLYELYGYSIKSDVCQKIIKMTQAYTSVRSISLQDNINEINISELYDSILSILSRGQVPAPLDNTYNNILIEAIIEKYKV